MILSYGLGWWPGQWTCTHNLRVILGQCAQCYSYEASEQNIGQKSTAKRKEIELTFLLHSICLDEQITLMTSNIKIEWKSSIYTHSKLGQKWRPALFWAKNWLFWPYFFEIWTSNMFCPSFELILRGKTIWKSIWPKLTILSSKKPQKLPYLKMPFWPGVNHRNPHSSYIFNEFVWNF